MNKLIFIISLLVFSSSTFSAQNPIARIETTMGNIELELYADKAPKTVENFIRYAKEGFYSGTIFHRVMKNFMIQGGGYTAKYHQSSNTTSYNKKQNHPPVANEAFNGLRNDRGTIAMARTNMPHSATSQFFINTSNNIALNFTSQTDRGWGYTVFGKVIKGMESVDRIESTQTGASGMFASDAPQTLVVINKVEIINK